MPVVRSRTPLAALLLGLLAGPAARADAPAPAAPDPTPPDWTLHAQSTWIEQGHFDFNSPYEGANSLTAAEQWERTFSFSLYAGYQFLPGLALYVNPDVFQGHGLSNTLGMAGYPNGEGVKAAFPNLHPNLSRLYLQDVIGLGGGKEKVEDGQDQVAGSVDVNRVTLSLGKFAADDFFDKNAYSADTRSQFMNWSLWESGAWDYPADVLGFTAGFVAEWTTPDWTLHYGLFMEPTQSNGARLDPHLRDAHGQILEWDYRYKAGERSGTVRPFLFWNQARMGSYALADAAPPGADDLIASRAYRSKVGFGVNWDQALTEDLGAFARLSWDDGRTESFAFTEIDRSVALGLSEAGSRWGRKDDTVGLAVVVNAIVGDHQAYLARGGLEGLILGDGALDYGPEEVLEAYYSWQATKWLWVTPDFQYAVNPGYNRDRGPVPIYALRVHVEF